MKKLVAIVIAAISLSLHAATLTPINIIAGSSSGQIFGWPACDGNAYKLTAYVTPVALNIVKTYLFAASQAPAVDAWLYTSTSQIIGEVHRITATKPDSGNPPLNYWEAERDYGNDSVFVPAGGTIWFLSLCYDPAHQNTTIEPYAMIYVRDTP